MTEGIASVDELAVFADIVPGTKPIRWSELGMFLCNRLLAVWV